jgi:hypothetical protein
MSVVLLATLVGLPAMAAGGDVLFIGNSYTQFNDPTSIPQSYAALVEEGMPEWEIETRRYARSGQTFPMHLGEAQADGSELHGLLMDTETWSWGLIVLQDQSQIPGFPQDEYYFQESLSAVIELAALVDAAGAQPRLFMTWGRRDGDPDNLWRYPDFPTMQGHLASGYYAFAEGIVGAGYPVEVVPVGMAWQTIYDDHTAVGEDPQDPGALFSRLYSGDDSHPSVLGSYLAGLVFYAAFTQQSPVGLSWAPDTVTEHDRDILQSVAARVMADAIGGGDDTGGGGGSDDTGAGGGGGNETVDTGLMKDTGGTDEAEDTAKSTPKETGCGCASSRGQGPVWLALIVLCLRRRTCTN